MSLNNTEERYGSISIAFHWIMLVLMIAVYACMELRGYFPKGSYIRSEMKTWHFMLGMSIFFLTFIRLAVRLTQISPAIKPKLPKWEVLVSKLGHWSLYALMFSLPLIGWLILNAEGRAVPFFGINLPNIISPDKKFAHSMEELHETIGVIGYYLIAMHTVAVLAHHYFMKDNTLIRMLPEGKK